MKIVKKNPEHPEQKTSTCTGTGQAVPVHLVQKWAVGKPVPVHPSSEQPIPVQVNTVPVQVVPAAPFLHVSASLSPVIVYRCLGTLRNY